ncbi:MAG: TonB-dependent receptor [Algicola sp.]|nr:TonB-dependent receptor [Algicola sp.]
MKVDAHVMADARLIWSVNDKFIVTAYVKNIGNKAVLNRAVVHSQIIDGIPANSVQASWNDPRTWGISIKYSF